MTPPSSISDSELLVAALSFDKIEMGRDFSAFLGHHYDDDHFVVGPDNNYDDDIDDGSATSEETSCWSNTRTESDRCAYNHPSDLSWSPPRMTIKTDTSRDSSFSPGCRGRSNNRWEAGKIRPILDDAARETPRPKEAMSADPRRHHCPDLRTSSVAADVSNPYQLPILLLLPQQDRQTEDDESRIIAMEENTVKLMHHHSGFRMTTMKKNLVFHYFSE